MTVSDKAETTAESDAAASARARPLSPHLGGYRVTLTMASSMAHRLTGAALYFGVMAAVLWSWLLLGGEATWSTARDALGSWAGQGALFLMTWALFHHLLGGLRHLGQDFGMWLTSGAMEIWVRAAFPLALGLNVLMWGWLKGWW